MDTLSQNTQTSASDAVAVAPASFEPVSPQTAGALVDVLHVINGEYYAGAERVQDLLAKRLPEFGFRVGFACVKLDLFDEMRESREAPLYDVKMWTRFDLLTAAKLAAIVRREQYRLIHAHTVRSALVGSLAARLAGVPMVYHAHSPASRDTTHPWRNRVNSWIERASQHGAKRIIAVSEAIAKHLVASGFDPGRIRVVHNGVPSPALAPERASPTGRWTLGVMALFRPRKGIETLLDAMAILRSRNVPVRLRAVGPFESTGYEAEIAARVRRLGLRGDVSWTGFRRDTNAELLKMDLLALPSLFGEGLPMVVLEAMAAGVPVVATRVEGVPEAIRDGEDGLLVSPGNAAELADAIARLVRGEIGWATIRASALARHAEAFSDHSMAEGVAAVYREVLDGR